MFDSLNNNSTYGSGAQGQFYDFKMSRLLPLQNVVMSDTAVVQQ
jgi:hypothetical protein